MTRLAAPRAPVTLHLDGAAIVAEGGEPVAVALIAAGRLALARSPKFHRPRGPACLRAACDGCLARVDGVPNVMTCRLPAREGTVIETQNVVGWRETDLLRVADWFFPQGMNHHELLAGVPGLQRVFQGLARRVAGVGRLPDTLPEKQLRPRPARRREADVLIVGSGPAGMAAAVELARRGRKVEVVDDDLAWGGSARTLEAIAPGAWRPLLDAFARLIADADVGGRASADVGGRASADVGVSPGAVFLRTTAAGVFGDDVLLAMEGGEDGESGVEVVRARTLVLAPGAHDGTVAFEGNDVPGVMSARAGCRLLAHRVLPGARIVVARVGGGGPDGHVFARAFAAARPEATVVDGVPLRVSGSSRIKAVTFASAPDEALACDALLVDAPTAPAYELAAQAGASLVHERSSTSCGFVVRTGPGGRVRDGVFVAGEAAGTPLEPAAIWAAARELAAHA
jgi:sarcosine oxidase subunit alpha